MTPPKIIQKYTLSFMLLHQLEGFGIMNSNKILLLLNSAERLNPEPITNLTVCFKEVNEGRVMDVLYMDFRKAFDELPHGRLIYRNGINGIHNGFRENKGFWWKIVILADRL